MIRGISFNPWFVGGGVKCIFKNSSLSPLMRFNPWFVGGGVKCENGEYRYLSPV